MIKQKTYCEWCGGETKNQSVLISKISLIEEIENKIEKLGREDVLHNYYEGMLIDTDPVSRAEIYAYLDLLGDVKKRIICNDCLIKDDELNDKYYSGLEMDDDELYNALNDILNKRNNNK